MKRRSSFLYTPEFEPFVFPTCAICRDYFALYHYGASDQYQAAHDFIVKRKAVD